MQSITSVDQNNQTGQVICQGTDQFGNAVDLSSDAANLSGAFEPYLPDVLSARISLPPDALKSGTFTKAVSSADAVAPLPASCADQFGEPEGQCPMSLSWSGTIKITEPCGVVNFSEGDAPAVGTLINPGDIVVTGDKSRVEIMLPDGGFYRVGPNSKFQCIGQTTTDTDGHRSITDSFHLLLGNMWAGISDALGGDHEFEQPGPTIGAGVRGSALTASVQRNGDIVYHVIQGTGFIKLKGKPEFDFPAGEGVRFDPDYGGYTHDDGVAGRRSGACPGRAAAAQAHARPARRRPRRQAAHTALHAQRERHRHRPGAARRASRAQAHHDRPPRRRARSRSMRSLAAATR